MAFYLVGIGTYIIVYYFLANITKKRTFPLAFITSTLRLHVQSTFMRLATLNLCSYIIHNSSINNTLNRFCFVITLLCFQLVPLPWSKEESLKKHMGKIP